ASGSESENFRLRHFPRQSETCASRAQPADRRADQDRFAPRALLQAEPGVERARQQRLQAGGMTPMPRQRPPSVRRRKPAPQRPATITAIPERGLKLGDAPRALGVETYV